MSNLTDAAVLLTAAVVAVPVARRLGLGAVLGYLAAGAAVGPRALGLIGDVDAILHFAELGIVLLLFIIGLELQPARLWTMRKLMFGLGGAQVLLTGGVLTVIGHAFGLSVPAAAVVGLALSLSSTAFALQMLAETSQLTTRHGRTAFAILLFQDLAAIPLIALVPALAGTPMGPMASTGWSAGLQTVAVVAAVAVGGRVLLRHAFRAVARARVQEVFTAAALLTVIATTLLMAELGLSAALGAFIAGVLLADSEYRHALEADLEPFKGLLLGLFFMAVGMSLNLGLIAAEPGTLALLVAALVAAKIAVLYPLGRAAGLDARGARTAALAISQGGEFAFVVLGAAVGAALLPRADADLLIAVVTLSMVTTPLLLALADRLPQQRAHEPGPESLPGDEHQVIIAGFGRVGQIVGRILRAKRIGFTALDASPEQVDFVARYGNKIFYGDASRLELLQAARADRAVVFVLAIDDVAASVRTAETVIRHFPHLKIFARARNRAHAYQLMELGIAVVWRETLGSSLEMAEAVLKGLGLPGYQAEHAVATFRSHDEQRLSAAFGTHRDDARMQALARKASQELEELFAQDAARDAAR